MFPFSLDNICINFIQKTSNAISLQNNIHYKIDDIFVFNADGIRVVLKRVELKVAKNQLITWK